MWVVLTISGKKMTFSLSNCPLSNALASALFSLKNFINFRVNTFMFVFTWYILISVKVSFASKAFVSVIRPFVFICLSVFGEKIPIFSCVNYGVIFASPNSFLTAFEMGVFGLNPFWWSDLCWSIIRILILRFCTSILTAVSFETRNGTIMSACFIVGLMNSSYAGLTKRLYCSRTSTTVLPLSAISLLTKANIVIQLTNL